MKVVSSFDCLVLGQSLGPRAAVVVAAHRHDRRESPQLFHHFGAAHVARVDD